MMISRRQFGGAIALGLLGPALVRGQKKNPQGTRVLLLSGGQREHHGYRDQAFYLARSLEDTGRYRVTINEDSSILAPGSLARYDLLILLADRRDEEFHPTPDQQLALFQAVRGGLGLVSIHGGDNAPKDWLPDWRPMMGGIFSHAGLPDGKTRKGDWVVKILPGDSPITRGLTDFPLKDELYYNIQMQPGIVPLATVDFQGQAWPVAWTTTFGKGRVFHTPLGHRDFGPDKPDPLRDPNLGRLVLQGIDWVANRPAAG